MTAPWWRSAVVYQIYPRSLRRRRRRRVGDLRGIAAPARARPRSGGRCRLAVADLPLADGGLRLRHLRPHASRPELRHARRRRRADRARRTSSGLRVLFDFVPEPHLGPASVVRGVAREPRSPRRTGTSGGPGGTAPPNNWISSFGDQRPAWTRDERTGEWYLHSFLPEQPDLNWDEPAVEEAMHDVLRFWLRRGVDGFRIDVVHKIGKDPALGDNEPGRRHDEDWPSVHPRLAAIRRVLEEFDGDRVAVGEVYVLDQRALARYVVSGDELHLAHNFFFLNLPWSAAALPCGGRRVRGADARGRLAGVVPQQPRPLAHRHALRARARAGRRDARADPARHAVPLPGRGARADGRARPGRADRRRRRSRPAAGAHAVGTRRRGPAAPRASPTASRGFPSTRTPSGWRSARRQATPLRRSSSTAR